MQPTPPPPPPLVASEPTPLWHRWFVQYNPLYLVSAALCLAGVHLLLRALSARDNALGLLGVEAVTEAYALVLIAGAALLTRIGQRRPGVMLALLAALYQADAALHTEACTYLGAAGLAASAAWAGFFVAKLRALAWAVKLRPSRNAFGLAAYGGAGLAVVPQLVTRMEPSGASALAALWAFSMVALGLEVPRAIASRVPLDAWGDTVLRRASVAVWAGWAAAIALHLYFWSMTLHVALGLLVPALPLLATRFVRGESRVWSVVAATLVVVAVGAPGLFAMTAVMASVTLALRARRHLQRTAPAADASRPPPFRGAEAAPIAPLALPSWAYARATSSARRRLLVGALACAYLAVWTAGWSGGPWPAHVPWLDIALTAVVALAATKLRARVALVPLAASCAHLAVQTRAVTAPNTTLGWGALCTGAAFALLLGSLATSYRLRETAPREREPRTAE